MIGLLPDPGTASLPVNYRQGKIVEWNPLTLANKIQVGSPGGPVFENLPVLGVAETSTFEPGDVVGLLNLGWTLAITGEFVIPGSPQALKALSHLSSRVFADTVETGDGTASANFTDLATPGPSVEVLVGPSGSIVTIIGSQIGSVLDNTQ